MTTQFGHYDSFNDIVGFFLITLLPDRCYYYSLVIPMMLFGFLLPLRQLGSNIIDISFQSIFNHKGTYRRLTEFFNIKNYF